MALSLIMEINTRKNFIHLHKMKVTTMNIRCIIKQDDDLWVAISLEFGLATQADTFDLAKANLEEQIKEYIEDAFGQNNKYKQQLLSRKGPASWFIAFYFMQLKSFFSDKKEWFFFTPNIPSHV